jgi:RNA polymerase sigma factor (sigma-70 family)
MDAVSKGNAHAIAPDNLEELYREHHSSLCMYVRRKFGSGPPDPDDVAQFVFAKFASIDDRTAIENPMAYFRRMAVNYVLETHRRSKVSNRIHDDVKIFQQEYRDLSPEDIICSKQELDLLNDAIARLKPKQRVALLMHRMDGMSFVEIGRELGISQSGARLLVDTALKLCAASMHGGVK